MGNVAYTINGSFFKSEKLEAEMGGFDIKTAAWNAAFG